MSDYSLSSDPWSYGPGSDAMSSAYNSALEQIAPSITTKIAEQGGNGESWTDTLQRILPLLATTYQQKEILNIQLERAKQGLPPLDNSQFGVGVSVGLSQDVKNYLLIGGIALAAVFLMGKKGR